MRFMSIPVLNLKRRPIRSLLTITGLTVAVSSFIVLVGLSRGLEKAWLDNFIERGTHLLATRKGSVEVLTASLKENLAEELRQVEGVQAVAAELADLVTLNSDQVVLVNGWEPQSYLWQTLHLLEGHSLNPEAPNEIVIGQSCAEGLGVHPGDTVHIHDREFIVAGIFQQNSVMANGTIVLPLKSLQALIEREGTVTVFNLLAEHPDNLESLADLRMRLSSLFPDLLFSETGDIANNNEILRLFRTMAWGTSCTALVIALVVVLNTLLMAVTERMREIGILSAVGWSGARILTMVVLEGIVLAIIGSVTGSLLGIYGLHYLADLPRMSSFLQPDVTMRLLCEIIVTTLLLGILGGLYPAYRAIRVNTVDALRYE